MKRCLLIVALLASACSGADSRHGGGGGAGGNGNNGGGAGTGTGGGGGGTGTMMGCDKMDILFIVDNSGSMSEEQTNLAQNFPKFIDVLSTYMTAAAIRSTITSA